jgi:hypothetical protein
MSTGDVESSSGRRTRRYRITVQGELTQRFLEPLEGVFVDSSGDESILRCEIVDQAKLQGVLSWLYEHGIEILKVDPEDSIPEFLKPPGH